MFCFPQSWNNEAAANAQAWVSKCTGTHSADKDRKISSKDAMLLVCVCVCVTGGSNQNQLNHQFQAKKKNLNDLCCLFYLLLN